ncbi:MAG: hypothetical protein AAGF71_08635 [Pseudomonadota bacterium]
MTKLFRSLLIATAITLPFMATSAQAVSLGFLGTSLTTLNAKRTFDDAIEKGNGGNIDGTFVDLRYNFGDVDILAALPNLDILWVVVRNSGRGSDQPLAHLNSGSLPGIVDVVDDWVKNGGHLIYSDSKMTAANNVVPGASGWTMFVENSTSKDIEVPNRPFNPLVTGYAGSYSDYQISEFGRGFAASNNPDNLPENHRQYLLDERNGYVVDFGYAYGNGHVYYSTTPTVRALQNLTNIPAGQVPYRHNMLELNIRLAADGPAPIPVPAPMALLMGGITALVVVRVRKPGRTHTV